MGPQTTKTILRFLDKAEYLVTSIRTQLKVVSPKLIEFFSLLPPTSEGEPAWPDWASVQEANAVRLEQATAETHQASQAYLAAKSLVNATLRLRNKLVKNLKQRYRNLRGSFGSTYTEEALPLTGLVDPPLRNFLAFREQCLFVIKRMRLEGLIEQLGGPVADLSPLDIDTIGTGLETAVGAIEAVLDDLREHQKLRDEALIVKQQAEDHLRLVYANVARIQEGYYRLAGLDELADRIRLTIPKSAKSSPPSTTPPTTTEPIKETEPSEETELTA